MAKPRVLLGDSNSAMLDYMSTMLREDYEIVGAVQDGRTALVEYSRLHPDVLLLANSMGELSGIEVARHLRDSEVTARIVFVTVDEDPEFVKGAMNAGAGAYVVKFRLNTDLLPAIRAVLAGKIFVSPNLFLRSCV